MPKTAFKFYEMLHRVSLDGITARTFICEKYAYSLTNIMFGGLNCNSMKYRTECIKTIILHFCYLPINTDKNEYFVPLACGKYDKHCVINIHFKKELTFGSCKL